MIERPILFSAPMVRAILDDRKTQTRRVVKPQPVKDEHGFWCHDGAIQCGSEAGWADFAPMSRKAYAKKGDRLYVRETAWQRPERTQKMMREGADTWPPFIYDADYGADGIPESESEDLKRWSWKRRPSIHLPRLGSRILLEVTAVRVERLQDISADDCMAEGIQRVPVGKLITFTVPGTSVEKLGARAAYEALWVSINGRESWDANPWVWVVSFERK